MKALVMEACDHDGVVFEPIPQCVSKLLQDYSPDFAD
jgi:hypothetical protein